MENTAREQVIEKLLKSYGDYFDVEAVTGELPLEAKCTFHSRSEKYVLTQKAKLWGAECNEYVYIFSLEQLDMAAFERCRDKALELGMSAVHPHSEHMYSYITAVIICDTIDGEAKTAIRKFRKRKDFKFALHGWMEFRCAAFSPKTGDISANSDGKDLISLLKQL